MPRAGSKKKPSQHQPLKTIRFSEVGLVAFAMAFATAGSYTLLKSFAAEGGGVAIRTGSASEEAAWLSSLGSAGAVVLAAGPIFGLLLWWLWRRSAMNTGLKLFLTLAPVLAVVTFAN